MKHDRDLFVAAQARQRRLQEELSATAMATLSGVVGGHGSAGAASGDGLWTFRATLAAWRLEGGALQQRPLTVVRTVIADVGDARGVIYRPAFASRVSIA